jgi:hypothetical protein
MAETRMAESDEQASPELLRQFIDNGFDSDTEQAALVLGRTSEELESMLNGEMVVDDDLEMKIRGIADERGIEV